MFDFTIIIFRSTNCVYLMAISSTYNVCFIRSDHILWTYYVFIYSSDQLKRVGQMITAPVPHASYKRLRQVQILTADH